MLWFLVMGAICCWYLYLYFIKHPENIPVYPGRIPLLGNVSFLLGDTLELWEKIKKLNEYAINHGNVVVFYAATTPIYCYYANITGNRYVCDIFITFFNIFITTDEEIVITDPDDCNTVLTNCMHKPWLFKILLRNFIGNGLLVAPVSVWKEHRKLITPTFNQKVLDSFMGIFNTQSRRLVDSWKDLVNKGTFDHYIHLQKNSLETICLTTAGIDISYQNDFNDKCLLAYRTVFSSILERVKNPFYYSDKIYSMSSLKKTENFHVGITHELTNRVLERKRQEYKINAENGIVNINSEDKFKPFLHRLLDLSNSLLSDKDIQDEMNNIILTGFESSSTIICYALLLLGTYPHIQAKCREEIQEVFGDSNRDVDKEDLPRLKYLEAVLKETLRLCPVAPITGRFITENVQLKNTVLRKRHICVVSLYGALNNPIWGSDVDKFVPERWLEPDRLPKNPNVFGAFGYGRRNCIGKVYAIMTMKVTLVHILRHYQVSGNYNNMKLKNNGINKPAYGHEISLELRQ